MTDRTATTAPVAEPNTAGAIASAQGFTTVKLVTPTGEESVDVPTAIAGDDNLLRNLLADSGISMAANGLIERDPETNAIKITKQADRNG